MVEWVDPAGTVGSAGRSLRSLGELEVAPDLVILAVEGAAVLDFAAAAAAGGRKRCWLSRLAQSRTSRHRPWLEARLLDIVRDAGLRLVGPNSLGLINNAPEVRLNATFTGASVSSGGLAICSPSGAVGIGLLSHAAALGLGVSLFASLGNRADVSTNDLLEWCEQDERTVAVILYVDTFGNPEHFTRIARRVSRNKPILAIKGRRSAARVLAEARSHTAAALRGDEVVDALLHQAGLLRFRSGDELFNAAEFFERQPLPAGRRIGIVSNSVGVATIAADAAAARGLEVRRSGRRAKPADHANRRGTGRLPNRSHQAAWRALDRCADGVLRGRSRGRPRRGAANDLDGVCRAAQAGCRVRGALRRTAATAHARRSPQLLVPGILRERARQRGRASRMAVAAAGRGPRLSRS